MFEDDPHMKSARILVHDTLKQWQWETLDMLGIDAIRVIECPQGQAPFIVRNAICPTVLCANTVVHPRVVQYLRRKLARPASKPRPGKRVFITRSRHGERTTVNEAAVVELLESYGFATLDPVQMTVAEQRDYFADVEMIVTPSGAALTNLLFCPEGTKVMSISCVHNFEEAFACLAAILKQKVFVCLSDGHPKPNPYYLWTPFDSGVDLQTLHICLDKMMEGDTITVAEAQSGEPSRKLAIS
jgi:capsular polysaccharide biosynthesis protein